MAKLTDVRDTPEIANGAKVIAVPVKGGTTIYQGLATPRPNDEPTPPKAVRRRYVHSSPAPNQISSPVPGKQRRHTNASSVLENPKVRV